MTIDINKISSIVTHLSQTIDYFRDYAKPKTGMKINLEKILDGIKTIMLPICKEKFIKMEFVGNFNEYKVDDRVDQVLLNLYKNSLDAYIISNVTGLITTSVLKEDDNIFIKVSDDAGGIDSETVDKVFQPYFSTKGKNGTGLGLYMSRKIVNEILDGSIDFNNKTDGIDFIIKLPYVHNIA